jgi:hypothetical protein
VPFGGRSWRALAVPCGECEARGMKPKRKPPSTTRKGKPAPTPTVPARAPKPDRLTSAMDFVSQMQGTLPEKISARDLLKLNHALEFLFADLRDASQLSREKGDDGRMGAAVALGAVLRLIVLFEVPLSEALHVPILRLQAALLDLQNNSVAPMLEPVRRAGRAPSSNPHAALKGVAAGAVKRLQDAGMDRPTAYAKVASELKKLGVKPERGSGYVTATTLRHWCDAVAEDVARTGTAAINYDLMFTADETARFTALPKDQARTLALESLISFVRTIFPETAGGKNPLNPSS